MEIRRILVPIDGSELSLKAAEAAAELAQHLVAAVTLFTAVEPPEAAVAYVNKEALEEVRRGLWRAAEVMLDHAAERIRTRQPGAEKRLVWGTPAAAIVEEAGAGHQLIVMGSRGISMMPTDRNLLGSVTERVLRRTHCPVLIIPS